MRLRAYMDRPEQLRKLVYYCIAEALRWNKKALATALSQFLTQTSAMLCGREPLVNGNSTAAGDDCLSVNSTKAGLSLSLRRASSTDQSGRSQPTMPNDSVALGLPSEAKAGRDNLSPPAKSRRVRCSSASAGSGTGGERSRFPNQHPTTLHRYASHQAGDLLASRGMSSGGMRALPPSAHALPDVQTDLTNDSAPRPSNSENRGRSKR